jgi:hypothetical protein
VQDIQGLWIGAELSVMERLSITSFLANGHPYHLYVYEDVKHIPAGTIVKDANQILPAAMIFKYRDFDSHAGFANYFRYKLLLEKGGWWADTDVVCLKPFAFDDEYVFASEISDSGAEAVASCVIKAPRGSDVMRFAWETCLSKNPQDLRWGETGPGLMQEAVSKFQLDRYRKSYRTFCPVIHLEWRAILEPETEARAGDDTVAIHLWNELWRRAGQDKNGQYLESSLYEQLKNKYLRPAHARRKVAAVTRENEIVVPGLSETFPMNQFHRTTSEEESLRERLAVAERTIRDLRDQLESEREGSPVRARLVRIENELESIYLSRAWKLMTWFRRIKYFFSGPRP